MAEKYFIDLSKIDRESDLFRYPFHIMWEQDEWEWEGKFAIKRFFNDQTHIDLIKFANKFEAAYEIIKKWYLKETDKVTQREYYKFANLENVLNTLAVLYIIEEYYVYSYDYAKEIEITRTMELNPHIMNDEIDKLLCI